MTKLRTLFLATALAAGLSVGIEPIAMAQASDAASAPTLTRQQQKAQRKAARKARRAQKNAQLKQLEQNGYDPATGRNDYPQNLQNAQRKIEQKNGTPAAPASAP